MKIPGRSTGRFKGLVAVALLSPAVAVVGVTGYLAWTSLRGLPDHGPIALSQAAIVTPVVPVAPAEPAATPAISPLQPTSVQPAPNPAINPVSNSIVASQFAAPTAQEGRYLLDLAHTLQPIEYQRLSPTEQLEMARQLQQWMQSGADFWGLYSQFDQAYGHSLLGDYDYNREVYIQLATQHLARGYSPEYLPPDQPPFGYGLPEYEQPGFEQPDYHQPNNSQPNYSQPDPYANPAPPNPNQPSPQIPNLLETST